MKHIQFFSLLCLFIVSPINIVAADMGVTWVRTGVVLETQSKNGVEGEINVATISNGTTQALAEAPTTQRLDANRVLLQFAWQPNQNYQFHLNDSEITVTSPLKPEPYLIRTVALDGLLSLMENLRQPANPSAVALGHGNASNAEKLAVATNSGHLAILQPITGETLWKTRISEGYVKQMAFSHNNTLLYVGEQAADGFIYCYDLTADPPTLRWKYRTADDIETSTPSNPGSVYAWVNYPGPSCMQTLTNGDLLVASVHSWTENDTPRKKSQLYRLDSETGNVIWKWPHDSATSRIIRWFDVSADGKTLALITDAGHNLQGAAGENGAGNGKLVILNAEDGREKWHTDIEPSDTIFLTGYVLAWGKCVSGWQVHQCRNRRRTRTHFRREQARTDMEREPDDTIRGERYPHRRDFRNHRRDGCCGTLCYWRYIHPLPSPKRCPTTFGITPKWDDVIRLFVDRRKSLAVAT